MLVIILALSTSQRDLYSLEAVIYEALVDYYFSRMFIILSLKLGLLGMSFFADFALRVVLLAVFLILTVSSEVSYYISVVAMFRLSYIGDLSYGNKSRLFGAFVSAGYIVA